MPKKRDPFDLMLDADLGEYTPLWEAGPEENENLVTDLAQAHKEDFIRLGILLLANKKRAYWSRNQHGSFKDFCEQLGLGSYSRMTRLADIAQLLLDKELDEATITEIGFSKMCLLLPGFKRGKVTPDLLELAKVAPYSDVRDELGYAVQVRLRGQETYICPRCGEEFFINPDKVRRAREQKDGDNQEPGTEAGEVAGQEH